MSCRSQRLRCCARARAAAVEHGVLEVRAKELLDESKVQADAHPVLVAFAVVGDRWEHAEFVEIDL
jgi:hypothetical protein